MFKQILKNISSLTAAKILAQTFAFFTTVYLSRILGVEKYGVIGYVTAIIIYLNMLSNLGLETYAIREVARHPKRLAFFVSHSLSIRLLASFFVFLMAVLIAVFTNSSLIANLLLLYSLNIFVAALSLNWTFAALHRMEFYGLTQIILQFVYMGFILVLVKNAEDIYFVPLAFITANLAAIIFTWGKHYKLFRKITLRFNPKLWRKMLKISLPIIVSYIILRLNMNFSILYFGAVGRQEEVGLFNAAFKIIFLLITVREVLISVAYPLMSKYFVESKERLHQVMRGFIKLSLLFALPVTAGGILLAGDLVLLIFGPQYIHAALPLRILLIAFLFMMVNIIFPSAQNAFNKQNLYFRISVINSASNVVMNILFIPLWGLPAAAAASAATELLSLILFRRESNKVVAVKLGGMLFKISIPTILMLAVLIVLPTMPVLLKISLGIAVYFPAIFVFRVLSKEEFTMMRAVFR